MHCGGPGDWTGTPSPSASKMKEKTDEKSITRRFKHLKTESESFLPSMLRICKADEGGGSGGDGVEARCNSGTMVNLLRHQVNHWPPRWLVEVGLNAFKETDH